MKKKNKSPRILTIDIETSPIISYTWALFDQNVSLGQIKEDWHILSFAAKFLDDPPSKTIYMDQRKNKVITDDKKMLAKLWELLDEAQIVIGQNLKKFDTKKINAKLIECGFPPYSSVKQIDTLTIAKKHFAFTSNKLEYMSSKLCSSHKKLKTKKFQGFELWRECLAGNVQAWNEMKEYNIADVLATEELYYKLIPWEKSINFDSYDDSLENTCTCGSKDFKLNGFAYTSLGRYQRSKCKNCGKEFNAKENLLSKEKRDSLRK